MDQTPGRFPPPPEPGPGDYRQPVGPSSVYPLDLGRVFEMTFSIFRFRWQAFVIAVLAIMVPVSVLMVAVQLATGDAVTRWYESISPTADVTVDELLATFPVPAFLVGMVAGAFAAVGTYVAQASVAVIAAETFSGQRVGAGQSLRTALPRTLHLGGAYLLEFAVILGIVALAAMFAGLLIVSGAGADGSLVPGPLFFVALIVIVGAFAAVVFVSTRWALVVQSVVLDRAGPVGGLGRSWNLVAGSTWRVLGYVLLFGLLFGVIAAGLSFIVALVVNPQMISLGGAVSTAFDPVRLALMSLLISVIGALILPFPTIALTLLYLDLRWRRGEPVPAPGSTGPTETTA